MKLILKEYLASLREREELDAVLPDLLSQMGLNVFISPSRGIKEYGVDVAAVGSLNGDVEKVYLFSIKAGNLTGATWDGDAKQSLRPSLNEIIDSFIHSRLPPEHQNKQIVICLCFGGSISPGVRQEVSGFIRNNSDGRISFEEWNGDKLAGDILEYMFKEALLPREWQSSLRKTLSLIDEPNTSSKHFQRLIHIILIEQVDDKKLAKSLIQLNLVLWVLFSWSREEENLESAYLSAEYSVLQAWEFTKKHPQKRSVQNLFKNILSTYHTITNAYLDKCIHPFVGNKHTISKLISAPCSISINLKLFDILGRLAIKGQWLLFELTESYKKNTTKNYDSEEQKILRNKLANVTCSINQLVVNNPLLVSPYKDEQAIDLALAFHLLYQDNLNDVFAKSWLYHLVERTTFSYITNGMYPCNLHSYEQLLEHKNTDKTQKDYKDSVTKASILYPVLTIFAELYEQEEISGRLESFTNEYLKNCTLQYWYPSEISEENLFTGAAQHGLATTGFPINGKAALKHVKEECKHSNYFWQLSAVAKGHMPLTLMACRYYRYPMPFNLLFPDN